MPYIHEDDHAPIDYRQIRADLIAGGERSTAAEAVLRSLGRNAWIGILEDASLDAKTKLYTQAALENDVHEVLSDSTQSGLLIVTDLVNFKSAVNDALGQDFGDTIIKESAKGLQSVVSKRRQDAIYTMGEESDNYSDSEGFRIGGDEFAVLLRNGDSLPAADIDKIVRRKVLGVMSYRPLIEKLEDNNVSGFGIRAGAALVNPTIHANFNDVLRDADPKKHTVCEYRLEKEDDHLSIKKIL